MALKLTRGISRLNAASAKLRTLAILILAAIIGFALIVPKGHNVFLSREPDNSLTSKSSNEQTRSVKPVQADQYLTSAAGQSSNRTATIVTCPRCRLNALPRVKEFVFEHAKAFEPGLKIDFVLGEDPVLHLYEDGKETEAIDLEDYDSKKIIHKLVQFGIKPSTETAFIHEALSKE